MLSGHRNYSHVSTIRDQPRSCRAEHGGSKMFVMAFLILSLSGLSFLAGRNSVHSQDWHNIPREFLLHHKREDRAHTGQSEHRRRPFDITEHLVKVPLNGLT